jgi:hypothetical protein
MIYFLLIYQLPSTKNNAISDKLNKAKTLKAAMRYLIVHIILNGSYTTPNLLGK